MVSALSDHADRLLLQSTCALCRLQAKFTVDEIAEFTRIIDKKCPDGPKTSTSFWTMIQLQRPTRASYNDTLNETCRAGGGGDICTTIGYIIIYCINSANANFDRHISSVHFSLEKAHFPALFLPTRAVRRAPPSAQAYWMSHWMLQSM